jgi:hypothetical protein
VRIAEDYQKSGVMPQVKIGMGIGIDGFREFAKIKTRIELPFKDTPGVVRFENDQDLTTLQIVRTYSQTRKPPEVILRFFVVPTSERMTTGVILKHLPWLPTRAGKFILGDFPRSDSSRDKEPAEISSSAFLDDKTSQKYMAEAYQRRQQKK